MKTIMLNNSDVVGEKVYTEYIHWTCPNCNKKNKTVEWLMDSIKKEMFCCNCNQTVKYDWNRSE